MNRPRKQENPPAQALLPPPLSPCVAPSGLSSAKHRHSGPGWTSLDTCLSLGSFLSRSCDGTDGEPRVSAKDVSVASGVHATVSGVGQAAGT